MMLFVDLTIRSSIVLSVGLLAALLLRRRSAALRHHVLAVALFAAAAIVPLTLTLPAWELPFPVRPPEAVDVRVEPDGSAGSPPPAGDAGTTPAGSSFVPAIAVVWAIGFLAGAGGLLAGLGRLAQVAARAEPVRDRRWRRLVRHVSESFGLERPVILLQTDRPNLLATWGVIRPRVLLPAHARGWSDDRIRVVLRHELAHVRRRDWMIQISADALRSVCWYNPLVWMVCARLRRESEQACDDMVLGAGVPARDYAAHLLELARLCRGSVRPWALALPMARPSTLERRIAAMLNPALNRRTLSGRATAVTAVLLLGVTLPAAALRAGQSAPLPMTGSVYDPSGAVMPGVQLTLQDVQKGNWQATTDKAGRFEFPPVQPGRYVIEASIPGFRELRHEFELRNARDWDRAITLQVGELSETVTVSATRTVSTRPVPGIAPQRIRVGGNVRAPRKQVNVNPVYPASMREAGREGVVPIEALIGTDGTVQSLRVRSAQVHPDFAKSAIDAVRQWTFDPTLLNGTPVEVVMNVTVEFSLSN
jgi:TonB family protein